MGCHRNYLLLGNKLPQSGHFKAASTYYLVEDRGSHISLQLSRIPCSGSHQPTVRWHLLKNSLMWTILKVFIEFVTILLLFYVLFFGLEVHRILPQGEVSAQSHPDPTSSRSQSQLQDQSVRRRQGADQGLYRSPLTPSLLGANSDISHHFRHYRRLHLPLSATQTPMSF